MGRSFGGWGHESNRLYLQLEADAIVPYDTSITDADVI